ncbi:MAG: hypothetical protein PW734_04510 [Verrucomicrobium sp.]|nr:hypothetical protein [Verrucomicrobium sp.]
MLTDREFWRRLFRHRGARALAACLVTIVVGLFLIGFFLGPLVTLGARVAGVDMQIDRVRWKALHRVELRGVSMGDYFTAEAIGIEWKWKYLILHRRFRLVELVRPQVFLNALDHAFPQTAQDQGEESEQDDPMEMVRRWAYEIRINKGAVWIGPFGPGLPPIRLAIGRNAPLSWQTGSLTQVNDAHEPLQVAETSDIRLYSPINPIAPVLDLGTLRITFTWRGLERHEIASVSVVAPTLYIGPNLFAFFDAVQGKGDAPAAKTPPPASPWVIQNLALTQGTLHITAFGEPGVVLPFTFRSSGQNINLADLDTLRLQNRIEINQRSFDYPSYGISLTGFQGKLDFNLPPGRGRNVVQWINLEELSWKGLKARDVYATVTFDRTGIYGRLGGKVYGGYMSGNYSVGFGEGFPWHAGLYLDHAEVKEPVEKLAHGDFRLQGKAGFNLTVDAKSRDIERCQGSFFFPQGGFLQIPSAREAGKSLQASADGPVWRQELQSQMVERIIDSFADYPFKTGTLDFAYGLPVSTLKLDLAGDAGRRNFQIRWNQEGKGITLPEKAPPKVSVHID